ncbi:hypothetical protein [Rubrivirga marina]|uniref:Uncharacterized protein n=1 Tax=Rubrivirga marina TaxID=1196024 RepID=A0A271J2L0_9BACT|nr:hypothetical protein [Rubrivirga marina]PAP76949.1 hypothetical protein BSZ37_11155 [Rubrivirga marina]
MQHYTTSHNGIDLYAQPRPPELAHYDDAWWVVDWVGIYAVRLDDTGFPEVYRVSRDDLGVYRLAERPLKWDRSTRYPRVTLSNAPRKERPYLHRLVLESVTGLSGSYQVHHADGDPKNPRLWDLIPVSIPEHVKITALERYASPNRRSKSGRHNIYETSSGRFYVAIQCDGDRHTSRTVPTLEAALDWRRQKAFELFGFDPFHPNS